MIDYLSWEDVEKINKLVLKLAEEGEKFSYDYVLFLPAIISFVKNNFGDDIFENALGYCISLIVLHPFSEGNHRTSLIASEQFLIKNGYYTDVSINERKKLQKWRLEYGEENNLERVFCAISIIEDTKRRNESIIEVMKSEYGVKIKNWLKKNFKVKTNVT